jgi:hypothetical protein
MFPQAIIVCALALSTGSSPREPPAKALPFFPDQIVSQVTRTRDHFSTRSSILGPWENPSTALLEEFMIDTSITYVAAFGRQTYPSVASDGTDYLVVWQDGRYGIRSDIYGTRVDALGSVLDPDGIEIASIGHSQATPSVAFDGTNYLVVWTDSRGMDSDIYGTRVGPSGAILDASGIPICTASSSQWYPSVAFCGTNYLVVWNDSREGVLQVYGTSVEPSGAVLDTLGESISSGAVDAWYPSVASDGSDFLVAWTDYGEGVGDDIYGARVDSSGALLDTVRMAISTANGDQGNPSVCFDGTNYLVVWGDGRAGSAPDIYGARVAVTGILLDTSGIEISVLNTSEHEPSVAFDGVNCLVVWQDNGAGGQRIRGTRVDTSGTIVDSAGIEISEPDFGFQLPALAFGSSGYVVVWPGLRHTSDLNIYGARVDTSGAVLDTLGFEVSTSGNWQHNPCGTFDGTKYFIVWDDTRTGVEYDVRGARLMSSGTRLDDNGILIGAADDWQWFPAMSFGGGSFLVVWEDWREGEPESDLYCTRVDTSGFVSDTSGNPISTHWYCQSLPSGAFGGSEHLVVWVDERPYPTWNIYGSRVDTLGTVLDTSGIRICTTSVAYSAPAVARGWSEYLVVWSDLQSGNNGDIHGARLNNHGELLDSISIPVSIAASKQDDPAVAFGGHSFFVVWADSVGGSDWDIRGARVDTAGDVLDTAAVVVSCHLGNQILPSVVFEGTHYLVVWQDYRNGDGSDIFGARVDTLGNVVDSLGLELVNEPYDRTRPDMTVGDAGQILLTFDGFEPSPYNCNRVFGAFYTGVGIEERESRLGRGDLTLRLHQNTPNPFPSRTTVRYRVPATDKISLKVYDSSGRVVRTLDDGRKPSGSYSAIWDGRDKSGEQLPSGIYFCRLQAGDAAATRKMILLR